MNPKLSDLGAAKIPNLIPAQMTQMTQTKSPGTHCYMPPNALTARPKYTSKIEIYSYRVLIIHTLCGRWPFPEDVFHPDLVQSSLSLKLSAEQSISRRFAIDHPLMGLIHWCLSNMPTKQPEVPALLERVNAILSKLPQPFTNQVEMLQHIQAITDANLCEMDSLRKEVERHHFKTLHKRHTVSPATLDSLTHKINYEYYTP